MHIVSPIYNNQVDIFQLNNYFFRIRILLKIIIVNFIKGFGNAFYLVLPYHIKSPYGTMSNVLNRDWNRVSGDIYKVLKTQKKSKNTN